MGSTRLRVSVPATCRHPGSEKRLSCSRVAECRRLSFDRTAVARRDSLPVSNRGSSPRRSRRAHYRNSYTRIQNRHRLNCTPFRTSSCSSAPSWTTRSRSRCCCRRRTHRCSHRTSYSTKRSRKCTLYPLSDCGFQHVEIRGAYPPCSSSCLCLLVPGFLSGEPQLRACTQSTREPRGGHRGDP